MKILFLAFEVPYPLDRGGRIKTYNTLANLCKSHEVYLLCLVRNKTEYEKLKHLSLICAKLEGFYLPITIFRKILSFIKSVFERIPFIISLYYDASFKKKVEKLINEQKYDLIYADHLHMAQYVSGIKSIPKILDQHNIEYLIAKRYSEEVKNPFLKYLSKYEWNKLKKYEIEVCKKFNKVITVSETDKKILLECSPDLDNIRVLPIGVDTSYFTYLIPNNKSKQLIFVGIMRWIPNSDGVLWFYENIYPKIISKDSDVKLVIVGGEDLNRAKSIINGNNVKIIGYLNDIRQIISDSSIFIVPLRIGSGIRVKILNALAQGIPVVSTSIGCEGVEVSHGENILIADNELEFAEAILEVFNNPSLMEKLSKNGRKLIEEKYDWKIVNNKFDKILMEK